MFRYRSQVRRSFLVVMFAVLARSASAQSYVIDVTKPPYSAVCNGVIDDSKALQSAINAALAAGGGGLLLPLTPCRFLTPLTIGPAPSGYAHVNFVGQSLDTSALEYCGPNTETAITLSRVGYFYWRGFRIAR